MMRIGSARTVKGGMTMPDREKVIEGIEAIREFFGFGLPSQSPIFEAYQRILTDTLSLLKEQETEFVYDEYVTPICKECGFHPFAGYIPTIKWMQERGYKACPGCGRKVKWE